MKKSEYIELVTDSEVYNNLTPEVQKTILAAKGSERESYVEIFTRIKDENIAANKAFIAQNNILIRQFELAAQKERGNFYKNNEQKDKKKEDEAAANLLNTISNI